MTTIDGRWPCRDEEGWKVKPQPRLSLEKTGAEVDEDNEKVDRIEIESYYPCQPPE
jgi:hypothetical protein